MSDSDTTALLSPSVRYEDDEDEEQNNPPSTIQIREGHTVDPYFDDTVMHDSGLPVEANVNIQPTFNKKQEIKSKPAALRTDVSPENTNVQKVRMPIAFPNPLRDTEAPEYDPVTSAALSRYKYYKHLGKYSATNNGNPAAEPVLVMPDHMIPAKFYTILTIYQQTTGRQKSIITIFALWNTMMGTALLSMPWAIRMAGFANGIGLLIFIAFLMLYSAYRIMTCTKEMAHLGFVDFSDVCRHYLGQIGYIICSVCSLISLIGGMIVYWILLSNFLYYTVTYIYMKSTHQFNNSTQNITVLCPRNASVEVSSNFFFLLTMMHSSKKMTNSNRFGN